MAISTVVVDSSHQDLLILELPRPAARWFQEQLKKNIFLQEIYLSCSKGAAYS